MIVASEPYNDQYYCTCKNRLGFFLLPFTLMPQYQLIKNTLKQMKCEDKIVKSTHSRSFQTVRRMREAWKRETYVRSQSFSSESAVKYLQDSNIPSPGRTRSFKCPTRGHNQIPTPCPAPDPPRRHNIDRYIISGRSGHTHHTNFPRLEGHLPR